MNTKQSVNILI